MVKCIAFLRHYLGKHSIHITRANLYPYCFIISAPWYTNTIDFYQKEWSFNTSDIERHQSGRSNPNLSNIIEFENIQLAYMYSLFSTYKFDLASYFTVQYYKATEWNLIFLITWGVKAQQWIHFKSQILIGWQLQIALGNILIGERP